VSISFALLYFSEPIINVYVYVTRVPGMREAIWKSNTIAGGQLSAADKY
jgi:hypothetical protein